MTDDRKRQLSWEWKDFMDKMQHAERTGQDALAKSYEASVARVESALQADDVDPEDWL